ncbi:hypothetical protein RFI_32732, partial [Reticulomyxa filosa]
MRIESSMFSLRTFVQELDAIPLSKQLELHQGFLYHLLTYLQSGIIKSSQLHPIMIQSKMLKKLKYNCKILFGDIQLRFDTKNIEVNTLDDKIIVCLNKERLHNLRAKEIIEYFTCEKSNRHMVNTLKCLNVLADIQISHENIDGGITSKSKTIFKKILELFYAIKQIAKPNCKE